MTHGTEEVANTLTGDIFFGFGLIDFEPFLRACEGDVDFAGSSSSSDDSMIVYPSKWDMVFNDLWRAHLGLELATLHFAYLFGLRREG